MRRLGIPFFLALLLVVISTFVRAQAPAAGRATVYEGARVIVGTASAPIENAAFVVENGKFTQVGRADQIKAPAGAARVDLRGKTVIPAIVDTHTHMPVNRDDAHKNKLRVTAHIFALDDAKGLLRAGLDAFAHSVRDREIDDEFMGLVKQRPALVVTPNLPDRGVAADLSWLAESVPAGELSKIQAAATNRPDVQQVFGIQARNLARLGKAGVKITLGTDGNLVVRKVVLVVPEA